MIDLANVDDVAALRARFTCQSNIENQIGFQWYHFGQRRPAIRMGTRCCLGLTDRQEQSSLSSQVDHREGKTKEAIKTNKVLRSIQDAVTVTIDPVGCDWSTASLKIVSAIDSGETHSCGGYWGNKLLNIGVSTAPGRTA